MVVKSYGSVSKGETATVHPEEKASVWSRIFLGWCFPLLRLGSEKQLEQKDIWPLRLPLTCRVVTKKLLQYWEISGDETQTTKTKSIFSAGLRMFGVQYFVVGLMLFAAYVCDFFGPIVLNNMVSLISEEQAQGSMEHFTRKVILWICLLFGTRFIKCICRAHLFCQSQIISMKFTSAIKSLVFQKSLRLSASSRALKKTGDIVNIYTTDVSNIVQAAFSLHFLWVLPLQIVAILVMLYMILGLATLAGVGVIILSFLLNNIAVYHIKGYFKSIMKVKDERMKAISELFGSIQIVKLNAWEEKSKEKISKIRSKELVYIWKYLRTNALVIALLWASPVVVSTASFLVYSVVLKKNLTAATVFTSLALFKLLQDPLRSLPNYITQIIQAGVSLKRVMEFMTLEELDASNVIRMNISDPKVNNKWKDNNIIVAIENGTFNWASKNTINPETTNECIIEEESFPVFRNLNLAVKKGEFLVVHGKVGCGKSSLCSLLLGDMQKQSGTVFLGGSVAYCSQQPWIQNLTVRENIIFGHGYDFAKYRKVIKACGLEQDLEDFPAGDQTEIGQKGLNISGGQKARISLARACYSDADIYILDSPLSAVDAIVQNEIFNNCLLGLLKHKTRILVTHSQDIINSNYVNRTISLNNNDVGVIHRTSSFQEISNPVVSPLVGRRQRKRDIVMKVNSLNESTSVDYEVNENQVNKIELLSSPAPLNLDLVGDFPYDDGSETKNEQDRGKLIHEEKRASGTISFDIYLTYFKATGGVKVVFFLLFVQIAWQMCQIGSDFWLTIWTKEKEADQAKNLTFNISIYCLLALSGAVMVLVRTLTVSNVGIRGAQVMFEKMTASLIKAPMQFFDVNPSGRILNRYSEDVSNIDFRLPFAFGTLLANSFSVFATLITAVVVTKYTVVLIVPLLYFYFKVGVFYLNSQREIRRLQRTTQSPILSHVSESVDGASVVRAFQCQHRFIDKNERVIDINNANQFAFFILSNWFALWMQLMGACILTIIVVFLVGLRNTLSPGVIGLAFNYGLFVDGGLQGIIQVWGWLETSMVSPERLVEYILVKPERPHLIPATEPQATWPQSGLVSFENVSFKYNDEDETPPVLDNLSFTIQPSEKIGIVGRTGAGKSSLTMALFRIRELFAGKITVDGIDISTLGLSTLRGRLSIITQTPVLFKGTLRNYLDPFDEYTDDDLWASLRKTELQAKINNLNEILEENGENFSVGERQMLCMSRVLLSKSNVVIMDEATASIDHDTDMKLQQIIKDDFVDSTVITIAHRLDTVMDSDRIMVLDKGNMVEFENPQVLLQKKSGHFYQLAKEGGYLG